MKVNLPLNHSVPQGPALGPILFTIYTTPLTDILAKFGHEFHICADGHKLYLSSKPIDKNVSLSPEMHNRH